jgi:hypothetical protein
MLIFAFIVTAIIAAAQVEATEEGLVAEWHFDEGSGTVLGDSSGNGNHGTIYGALWTADGKFGTALEFDGINDYVQIPDSPDLSGGAGKSKTVEFWFKSNKQYGCIVTKWQDQSSKDWGATVGLINPGLSFWYERSGGDRRFYGGTIQEGVWHHGAFTFEAESPTGANNANLILYLDGEKVDLTFWNDQSPYNVLPDKLYNMPDTGAPVSIGYSGNYYKSCYFDGVIDEMKIFNRVLSPVEIKAEYKKGGNSGLIPVITNPNDGDTVFGMITLEETTTETDVVSNLFEYSSDGVTWNEIGTDTDGSDGWTMEWDTTTVPNGNYYLRYTMTDADGNQGSSQISITVANQGNAPLLEIIKPGVIFEGTFNQFNYGTYPMIMEITAVDGLDFNGILHWPTLGDSKTKFKGKIDSILNQIWFTEYEQIQGSVQIVLNGNYYAELQDNTLNGYWNWPSGVKGGTFSITTSGISEFVISELLPEHNSHLGSTSVQFSWRTNLESSSDLFIKRQDETTYSHYTGNAGIFHAITIDNLLRNTWYNFYVSSGSKESEVRSIYIDNGIVFTQKSYNFNIERDYSQQATVTVQNTDSEPHSLLVSVNNPYDDLIVGFIGDGSHDQEITLDPGESRDVILSIFAMDAMLSEYQLQIDLNSIDSNVNDHAVVNLNVRQPNIDFTVTEIGVDPYTLTKTFQVTNNGDRITDFTIFAEDGLEDRVLFKPAIIHANVGSGESLTFKLVPLLESDTPITGFINATGAGNYERIAVDFSQSGGKTLFTSVLSDVNICMGTNSWYCTNRPNIRNTLSIPPGFDSSDVEAAVLAVDFSLPWSESYYRNHNVDISLNGHHVKSLNDIVPNGLYLIAVDPSFLNYGSGGTGVNQIDINTKHLNGGHYVVATNIEFRLKLKQLTTKLFADSQEEADNIVKNLDILCDKCVPKTEIISVESSPPQLEAIAGQDVTFDVNVNLKNVQNGALEVDVFKGDSLVKKSFKDVAGSPETTETFTISFKAPDAAGSHEYKILTRFREGASGELIDDSLCDVRQQSTYKIVVTVPVKPQDKTLVKVEGQLEAYWFQNNKLYWVTSPEIITKMSGIPGWESVNPFPASVFNPVNYEQGPSFITTGSESDGLLIREDGDYKVYLIENGKKRHITYPDVMDLKGHSFDDVIEVSSEISNMFQVGDPVGIEVDLYFNKLTGSGESPRESQFTTGNTIKFITETTVVEDYTVETYVRLTYPDGITKKYAYHENPDLSDQLKFSETERPFYPGTWQAETKTWPWNEYTFTGDETEGVYTWEFWYKDTASGKILGKDVQGYEFSKTPPEPIDNSPPLIKIISPVDGSTVYSSNVPVSGLAFDPSGIKSLTVNGNEIWSIPYYGVKFFGSFVNLKEGINEIIVAAIDDSENNNERIEKITINYYPYNVKINSPEDGSIFKEGDSIKLEGKVTGGTPQFDYEWLINGEVKNSGTSDNGLIEHTLNGLALGEYKVKLRVTDFKGYVFETNEIQIFIKEPKPDIIVTDISFSEDYPAEGEPITITARIKNIGHVNLQEDFVVYFWQVSHYDKFEQIDKNPYTSVNGGNAIINSSIISELASGEEKETEIVWNVGPGYDSNYPGKTRVKVSVDDLQYLFSWDDIPGNDDARIKEFLKQNFYIDWVETAKIEKIDDNKVIKIYTDQNSLLLGLNDEKTEVSLKIDDMIIDDMIIDKFIAKTKNDKLIIYQDKIDEVDNDNNMKFGEVTVTSRADFKPEIHAYHFGNFPWTDYDKIQMMEQYKDIIYQIPPPELVKPVINELINIMDTLIMLKAYDGNCWGISSSSILYYQNLVPKPENSGDTTFEMLISNQNVRDAIYHYQIVQMPYVFDQAIRSLFQDFLPSLSPSLNPLPDDFGYDIKKEYENIEYRIKNDGPVLIDILFLNIENGKDGNHAVVAFNTYDVSNNIKNVLVYDPNYPGMARVIQFDLENNKINYNAYHKGIIYAKYSRTKDTGYLPSDIKKELRITLQRFVKELISNLDKIKSYLYIFDCPIDITITDQYGRIIDNKGNNGIPSANVKIIGDSKMFLLPADLDYTINIDAYDSGDFTFTQINPLTSEYASLISFVEVPITENTEAISEVSSTNPEYKIKIDYDGDGTIDEIIMPDIIDIVGAYFYNITFLPPITTMDQFSLTDGSTLPIKFTARNSTTDEFIYDDTVNVTITNSTGSAIANFNITNGVQIDSNLEHYSVDFNTMDYPELTIGETYSIQVTFGDINSLRGYAIAYFTLVDLTPPSSLTNLTPTAGTTWLNWTWLNPPDPDFNHTEIYLNGAFQTITSSEYFNATDLTPGTEYTISTRTVDTSGNINTTWENNTASTLAADTAPPVISNVGAASDIDSAVITWNTDEASDSLVKYGTSSGNYPLSMSSSDMVLSHSLTLTGLSSDTLYYYVVNSTDAQDHSNESAELTFRTLAPADTAPPVIESVTLYPANTTAGSTINISVTASDNVGVVEVAANGTPLTYSDGLWNGSMIAASSVGNYTLLITAKDIAGNTAETSAPYRVLLREGGASVSVAPRANNVASGKTVLLNIKVKNTQNIDDVFRVHINVSELPSAYQAYLAWFEWTENILDVRYGQEIIVPMNITIPGGVSGTKVFRAKANSMTSTTPYVFDTGYLVIS